jgi:hypothetical protein
MQKTPTRRRVTVEETDAPVSSCNATMMKDEGAFAGSGPASQKRRGRRLLCVVLPAAVLLTACTPDKHWSKAGTTYEQFGKDSYECATQTSSGGEFRKDMYRACLQGRGYQFVPGGEWGGVRD